MGGLCKGGHHRHLLFDCVTALPSDLQAIALVGEFNDWEPQSEHWAARNDFGVWELFLPDAADGSQAIQHRWVCHAAPRAYSLKHIDSSGCCIFLHRRRVRFVERHAVFSSWGDSSREPYMTSLRVVPDVGAIFFRQILVPAISNTNRI